MSDPTTGTTDGATGAVHLPRASGPARVVEVTGGTDVPGASGATRVVEVTGGTEVPGASGATRVVEVTGGTDVPRASRPEPSRDWMSDQLDDHVRTARATADLVPQVRAVGEALCAAFADGGTLWTFGNGGSAADAQHLTGEIIGHYRRDRRPLGAVTLSTDPTTVTCIANDYAYDVVFARQVQALARPGDVVAAFSTSGSSPNVVAGLAAAHEAGATTVLFAGGDGGPAAAHADHRLVVPSTATARIQEMHTFMLHAVSEMVDAWADGDEEYR